MRMLNDSKQRSFLLLTIPSIILFVVFFIQPLINGIFYSFTDWNGIGDNYNFIGLENYINIFSDQRVLSAFKFTIVYTILLTIAVLIISLLLAVALNSQLPDKVKVFFRSIYFFPAVLSLIVVGLIFQQIYYTAFPLIGEWVGMETLFQNPLGNANKAVFAILAVNIWQGIAVPMVIFISGIQSIPEDVYESATLDGATDFEQFLYITLPFLMPTVSVNFVLTIKSGLTVFDYIMSMTGGGPARATESVGLLIYNQGFSDMRYGYALAQSVLLLVLIALISIIQVRTSEKREVGQV